MMDATGKLKEHNISMLPVMKKDKLVGILTDRDLKKASASDANTLEVHELLYIISNIKVKDLMTKRTQLPFPRIIPSERPLNSFWIKTYPAFRWSKNGEVAGVITKSDIFRALISLTGLKKMGTQFAFELEDRPGSIKEVSDIIRRYGGRMASILSSYDRAKEGRRKVYIRMYGIDRPQLEQLKEELKKRPNCFIWWTFVKTREKSTGFRHPYSRHGRFNDDR
jgi:acetoin utilization protein AcuB